MTQTLGITDNGDEVYELFTGEPNEKERFVVGKTNFKVFLYQALKLVDDGRIRLAIFGMSHEASVNYARQLTRNVPKIVSAINTSSVAEQDSP